MIYDYKCKKCDIVEPDVWVQSYDEKVKCPTCKSVMTQSVGATKLGNMGKDGRSKPTFKKL